MAKTFTKDEVKSAEEAAHAKGEAKGAKAATKNAGEQLKAEIERVKASDLGKAEQKAAIAHLKNLQGTLKAPF